MSRIDEIRARLDARDAGNGAHRAYVDLIAHAPADIAWLLDEVERLQEVEKNRERLGAKLRDYMNSRDCNG